MTENNVTLIVSIAVPFITMLGTVIPIISGQRQARKETREQLKLLSRDMHRLTMHDDHLPLEERIKAGDRYLAADGNGASRVYHSKLVDEYMAILDKRNISAKKSE